MFRALDFVSRGIRAGRLLARCCNQQEKSSRKKVVLPPNFLAAHHRHEASPHTKNTSQRNDGSTREAQHCQ
eukprot:scaffold6378_cov176-Amphora_coffeaeformis.AAC.8